MFLSCQDREKIEHWLKELDVRKYKIRRNGKVDVNGNVYLERKNLYEIPVQFGKVTGNFKCNYNKLTSLKGAPKEVKGGFECSKNKLTSLEGAPEKISRNFNCVYNKLTSLKGAPKKIKEIFECKYNKLTSLKGAPKKVGGDFYCHLNPGDFTKEDVREVSDVKGEIIVVQ